MIRFLRSLLHIVFIICILTTQLFFSSATAQHAKYSNLDIQTRKSLQWLITGKGEKPKLPGTSNIDIPSRIENDREEKGDAMTEIEFFKRSYPGIGKWDTRERQKALQHAVKVSEERSTHVLASPPTQWEMRGPSGMEHQCSPGMYWSGRVTCLEYNNGLYVGTGGGGLWRPMVFMFVPITDKLPTLRSGSIAVHPTLPGVIYNGTGDYFGGGGGAGVFKTTDYGDTWSKLLLPHQDPWGVSRILIAPWDNDLIFIASDQGISQSTDGGNVWTSSVWTSTSDLQATNDGTVLLKGTPFVGVERSLDSGRHWTRLPGLPTDYIENFRIAISPSNPNRAYVQVAKPIMQRDPLADGQVRGVYRTDNLYDATPTWTTITPTGSLANYMYGQGWWNNVIAVDPTNDNIVWLGGGLLLKSINGGTSWLKVSQYPHADIKVIYFRPEDNLLYVGSDGGVFTTEDGGVTWNSLLNKLLPTTMFYTIDVSRADDRVVWGSSQDNATEGTSQSDPDTWLVGNGGDGVDVCADSSNVLAAFTTTAEGQVFQTTSGGAECPQWRYCGSGTPWNTHVYQDPSDASMLYFNGTNTINYSSDNGTTWQSFGQNFMHTTLYNAVSKSGTYLYVILQNPARAIATFRRSLIDPPTWTRIDSNIGLPAAIPANIVPSLIDDDCAYLLFNGTPRTQRIFKTTTTGSGPWINITGNLTSGIAIHDIVESPLNPDVLWLGTDLGVFKSSDGGNTWFWWNRGMPHAIIVTDLDYVFSTDGDYLLCGTYGRGAYQRDVNAQDLRLQQLGHRIYSLSGKNKVLVASTDSGRILKSADGGKEWEPFYSPSYATLYATHMFDTLHFLAVGQTGTLLETYNGGIDWSFRDAPTMSDLKSVFFMNDLEGVAVGQNGVIIRTVNGGGAWDVVHAGEQGIFHSVYFTDEYTGFAAGVDNSQEFPISMIYRTTDRGETWDRLWEIPNVSALFSFSFPNPQTGYCTGEAGWILKTTDYGQSWSMLQTNHEYNLYGCYFLTADDGWVCGQGGTLLSTSDGGITWFSEGTGVEGNLSAVYYLNSELFVGAETGIIKRTVLLPVTQKYEFKSRWNMVSVPLGMKDYTASVVFPSAISNAYAFFDEYVMENTLQNGIGYWLKFDEDRTISMNGYLLSQQVIDVREGWNMIGSVSAPIAIDHIEQQPENIVESNYYGYSNGYQQADRIEPGKAYWIKVNQGGQLILNSLKEQVMDSITPTLPGALRQDMTYHSLLVTDYTGNKQQLYFSNIMENGQLLKRNAAPPIPPTGVADIRFQTNTYFECANGRYARSVPIITSFVEYPVTITWDIQQSGEPAYLLVHGEEYPLVGKGSIRITHAGSDLKLLLPKGVDPRLPKEYALFQNYPNPFNPQTSIKYQLPVPSRVTLTIYDVLGREVTTLVKEVQDAGHQSVEWNARTASGVPVSNGIYFYRLDATTVSSPHVSFSQVKKMILLQ